VSYLDAKHSLTTQPDTPAIYDRYGSSLLKNPVAPEIYYSTHNKVTMPLAQKPLCELNSRPVGKDR